MIKLYLDDVRTPLEKGWDIVRNYDEFVSYLKENGLPDMVSFDHDLAPEHYTNDMYKGTAVYNRNYNNFKSKTGFDCAKFLGSFCYTNNLPYPKLNIHSENPAGSENIHAYLLGALLIGGVEDPKVETNKPLFYV